MSLANSLLIELKASPLPSRLFFVWLISGLISLGLGLDIPFIPSHSAELVLLLGSVVVGIALFSWAIANDGSKTKLAALPLVKRIVALSFMPPMFILISFGNLYAISYWLHTTIANDSTQPLTVSSVNHDIDLPWRCKYYARFSNVGFFYLRKMCLSHEEYKNVRPHMSLEVSGSQSPLGFRPTSIVFVPSTNPPLQRLRRQAGLRP